jgi:hypothetical protein
MDTEPSFKATFKIQFLGVKFINVVLCNHCFLDYTSLTNLANLFLYSIGVRPVNFLNISLNDFVSV